MTSKEGEKRRGGEGEREKGRGKVGNGGEGREKEWRGEKERRGHLPHAQQRPSLIRAGAMPK